MKIKFKVQMTQQYMYDFVLQHIYRSVQGVISLLAGLAVLTLCICTLGKVDTVYSVCYAFFALFLGLTSAETLVEGEASRTRIQDASKTAGI